MSASLFRSAVLVLQLGAPDVKSTPSQREAFGFWFEASGLTPEQTEIVAAGFADAVESNSARFAPAVGLQAADVVVQLVVGVAGVDVEGLRPISAVVSPRPASTGAERQGAAISAESAPTIGVSFKVVDLLGGTALYDETLTCELPLTRGTFVAATCLRAAFARIVERMKAWADQEAAALAEVSDFGPLERELRGRDPAELAAAYAREAGRAARAGFDGRALDLMAEAQPLYKEIGARREEGAAWEYLAYLMASTHRGIDRAIDYAEQTVRIGRELSDAALEVRGLALLAACEARSGNYDRAARVARSASDHASAIGDMLTQGMSGAILAGISAATGNLDQARQMQEQALELVRAAGQPLAEARILLAKAAVTAQDGDRVHSESLAQLAELEARAAELADLALLRDVAFVAADARASTTDLPLVRVAEINAIHALKLSERLGDGVGEAAALGLLGALGVRLGKLAPAFEYLAAAEQKAEKVGFVEGATASFQVLGEEVPDLDYGVELLQATFVLRTEQGDLRGQIKTLSDLSRLQAGLERPDDAWASYRAATGVLEQYVATMREGAAGEDLRESFATVLKSLVATRTQLPYLAGYLRIDHMLPLPNPGWETR